MSEQPRPTEASAEMVEREDRYATLLSRCQTSVARQLTFRLHTDIADWERRSGKRVRRRLARVGVKYVDVIERFVGDLLRAGADHNSSGRIFRATGKDHFKDEPVTYDVFMGVLDGLKALRLVEHEKGQTRFSKVPEWGLSYTLPGRASRFWATDKLMKLAETFGIQEGNVGEHFRPEPPT